MHSTCVSAACELRLPACSFCFSCRLPHIGRALLGAVSSMSDIKVKLEQMDSAENIGRVVCRGLKDAEVHPAPRASDTQALETQDTMATCGATQKAGFLHAARAVMPGVRECVRCWKCISLCQDDMEMDLEDLMDEATMQARCLLVRTLHGWNRDVNSLQEISQDAQIDPLKKAELLFEIEEAMQLHLVE